MGAHTQYGKAIQSVTYLQRYDELAALLPGEVDIAKLAFSQGTTDLKVAELPSPLRFTSLLAANTIYMSTRVS